MFKHDDDDDYDVQGAEGGKESEDEEFFDISDVLSPEDRERALIRKNIQTDKVLDLTANTAPTVVQQAQTPTVAQQADMYNLTLPSLTHLAPLKSLITLYINICKITIFPSTQYAYIYDSIFLCKLCYKDKLGQTYINMHIEWKEKM